MLSFAWTSFVDVTNDMNLISTEEPFINYVTQEEEEEGGCVVRKCRFLRNVIYELHLNSNTTERVYETSRSVWICET